MWEAILAISGGGKGRGSKVRDGDGILGRRKRERKW